METHIFDGVNRIASKDTEELALKRWSPPKIDETGHMIYAQPREMRRERNSGDALVTTYNEPSDEEVEKARQEGIAKGRQEGLVTGKAEGIELGKKEGLEQGLQQGRQKAQQELDVKLLELNKLLTSVSHSLNEEDYKLEQAIMNLVTCISEAVIKKESSAGSGHIMPIIKEVIAALPPSRDNIKILLNPQDRDYAQQAISQGGENWRVVADEDISLGGCKVVTEQSVVDYTTETRFKNIIAQLVENQTQGVNVDGEEFEQAPEPVVKATMPLKDTVSESPQAEHEGLEDQAHNLPESPTKDD